MSLGECLNFECATPLDFDGLLVRLFGVDSNGCIGMKIVVNSYSCDELTSAVECASDMTLQEIVQNAIVDDGEGGVALNVFSLTDNVTCVQDCGQYKDFESLLKSLFSMNTDGCFGLRAWQISAPCAFAESYDACSAEMTLEQIVRTSLWTDACGNPTVGLWLPEYITCGDGSPCGIYYSFENLVKWLIRKYTEGQCGGINLNYQAIGASAFTDLVECGKYLTFEDAFKASINTNDCGIALTVWSVDIGIRQ
jgi:hypothetical protein